MAAVAAYFDKLRAPLDRAAVAAPLFMRFVLGCTMFWHGYVKFRDGLSVTTDFFRFISIPAPGFFAVVIALLELIGGILILAGLATRVMSLLFIVTLLVAVIRYKYGKHIGYIGADRAGAELDWALIAGFLTLALRGAGPWSADHRLGLERAAAQPSTVA